MSLVSAADVYRAMVADLAARDSTEVISNTSTEHARILVERMFYHGDSQAMMYTGSLNPKIYAQEEIVDALATFLEARKGRVDIVIEKTSVDCSDAELTGLDSLMHKLSQRLTSESMRRVTLSRADEMVAGGTDHHFLVIDEKSFRYEPDNQKHEAFASFNRPDVAKRLASLFRAYKERSTTIDFALG